MRLKNKLTIRFPDAKMESEYSSIKNQNAVKDHQVKSLACLIFIILKVTMIFLVFMNVLNAVYGLLTEDYLSVYMALSVMAILLVVFLIRRIYSNYINHLTLIAVSLFSLTRFIIYNNNYDKILKAQLFFFGYATGIIQCIVMSQIHKIRFKIFGTLLAIALRFGLVIGVVDTNAFSVVLLMRQLFIESFAIFMYFSNEKSERKIFQNYYESREELFKFKELIEKYFPQSIIILECDSQKPLFSNNAFLSTFADCKVDTDAHYNTLGFSQPFCANNNAKSYINLLRVETSTIREMGQNHTKLMNSGYLFNTSPYLEDILTELNQRKVLENKTLTFTATNVCCDEHKSFEIILKKIKWDRTEALALILNDITHQEDLITMKVADNNKEKIIATVSHELRTPIHGILSLLENTENKVEDPEILETLSLCKDNAYLLWSLVNSIVDLQQISTGKLRLNITATDIRETLRKIKRIFQFPCKQKGIYLNIEVDKELSTYIMTDENRFTQILVNLVGNAIKFTFHGGIKIEAKQDPDNEHNVQINVIDTGVGIKEEERGSLFTMYKKDSMRESVNKNGVGIGLTVANALALILNGKIGNIDKKGIGVMSEQGRGSRFFFTISKQLDVITPIIEQNFGKTEPDNNRVSLEIPNELCLQSPFDPNSDQIGNEFQEINRNDKDASCCYLEESVGQIDVQSRLATYVSLKKVHSQDLALLPAVSKNSLNNKDAKTEEYLKAISNDILELDILKRNASLGQPLKKGKFNIINAPFLQASQTDCILVVDDTPLNLLAARYLVTGLGYPIKTAMGGQEAIDIVKACENEGKTIKAILMDCQMPVMDGYETTKILLGMMERNEIKKVPILAWTANNSEEDVKRCYECGMIGHLTKPTSQETLLKALLELE